MNHKGTEDTEERKREIKLIGKTSVKEEISKKIRLHFFS
jgi:hypothetical protein